MCLLFWCFHESVQRNQNSWYTWEFSRVLRWVWCQSKQRKSHVTCWSFLNLYQSRVVNYLNAFVALITAGISRLNNSKLVGRTNYMNWTEPINNLFKSWLFVYYQRYFIFVFIWRILFWSLPFLFWLLNITLFIKIYLFFNSQWVKE